jgi:hypothetical protein
LVLALLLGLAGPSWAQFSAAGKGTTAGTFLELGVGGRAMGMGGAYTAVADGADALYWNPAGLTGVERHAVTFMHAAYLQSSYYDYGAYAQNLGAAGAFGFGFQYLNAGAITQTDANFNAIGSFTPYDLALSLGYAKKLDFLGGYSVGASAKYIQSHILATAKTAAFDVGVQSPAYLNKRLTLAATATNFGGTLKFAQERDNLPLTFKAGGAFHVTPRWLASADVALPRDDTAFLAVGTEYVLPIKDAWSVAARAGYSSQTLGDVTGLSGWSLGVGFGSKAMSLDYAFAPFGGLGITNRFSAAMRW